MSAAYAADPTSNDISDQGVIDTGVSDGSDVSDPVLYYTMSYGIDSNLAGSADSGLTDGVVTDASGSNVINGATDPSSEVSSNSFGTTDNVYTDDGAILDNAASPGDSSKTIIHKSVQKDPQQVNDTIPMQKTGAPILPALIGIISIMGGFMVNRIRS
jgi:hypothetical protein